MYSPTSPQRPDEGDRRGMKRARERAPSSSTRPTKRAATFDAPKFKLRNEIHHHMHRVVDMVATHYPRVVADHAQALDEAIQTAKDALIDEIEYLFHDEQ